MTSKRTTFIGGMIFAIALAAVGLMIPVSQTNADEIEASTVLRVGTFDSRGVALAYGRSARPDCMLAKVEAIRNEHTEAEAAGDQDAMDALANRAQAMQKEIHKQVFSGAPIDDILKLIEGDMEAVAQAADVQLIASEVLYEGPQIELVDITLEMCAPFEPDEETTKIIKDLMTKPVVPESDLDQDH